MCVRFWRRSSQPYIVLNRATKRRECSSENSSQVLDLVRGNGQEVFLEEETFGPQLEFARGKCRKRGKEKEREGETEERRREEEREDNGKGEDTLALLSDVGFGAVASSV